MLRKLTFAVAALALMAMPLASARADVVIGLRLPVFVRPYHRHYYGPAVVVTPAPIVVGPTYYAPPPAVYVQPAPQVIQVPPTQYVPVYPAPYQR